MYIPCKGNIETVGDTTIIKQQWLVIHQTKRKDHPRNAVVTYIIIAINKKRNEGHHIVLAIYGNEPFINESWDIARICRECKLFDLLDHKYGNAYNSKSFLRVFDIIDFLLCPLAILTTILRCGMTRFNDITTSDHCWFFLDLPRDVILKGKTTTIPSPFERKLQSKSPKSERKYKNYLQKQITKYNNETQIKQLVTIGKQCKLTQKEEVNLNRIY